MIVQASSIRNLIDRYKAFQALPLANIEWQDKNGNKVEITAEELEDWRFVGLSNIEFFEFIVEPKLTKM